MVCGSGAKEERELVLRQQNHEIKTLKAQYEDQLQKMREFHETRIAEGRENRIRLEEQIQKIKDDSAEEIARRDQMEVKRMEELRAACQQQMQYELRQKDSLNKEKESLRETLDNSLRNSKVNMKSNEMRVGAVCHENENLRKKTSQCARETSLLRTR